MTLLTTIAVWIASAYVVGSAAILSGALGFTLLVRWAVALEAWLFPQWHAKGKEKRLAELAVQRAGRQNATIAKIAWISARRGETK